MNRKNVSRSKHIILAALAALLLTAMPGFSKAKSNATQHDRANVLLRFVNEGTVGASCSEELGLITQSLLQLDGVKNVKVEAKNNGVQVSYDPGTTTPEKIVLAFNKENPETPLQLPSATKVEQVNTLKRHGNRLCSSRSSD